MKAGNTRILIMISLYAQVFGSPNGKRVFADLRKSFGGSTFDPNPFTMAYKSGSRDVILRIEAMIKRSKNKALLEQLSREEED